MRMPRPKFTVRRLMIGVAIIALGFGLETARKQLFYLGQARHFASVGDRHDEFARDALARGDAESAEDERKYAGFFRDLSNRYRLAASEPWKNPPPGVWPAGFIFPPSPPW